MLHTGWFRLSKKTRLANTPGCHKGLLLQCNVHTHTMSWVRNWNVKSLVNLSKEINIRHCCITQKCWCCQSSLCNPEECMIFSWLWQSSLVAQCNCAGCAQRWLFFDGKLSTLLRLHLPELFTWHSVAKPIQISSKQFTCLDLYIQSSSPGTLWKRQRETRCFFDRCRCIGFPRQPECRVPACNVQHPQRWCKASGHRKDSARIVLSYLAALVLRVCTPEQWFAGLPQQTTTTTIDYYHHHKVYLCPNVRHWQHVVDHHLNAFI